MNLYFLFAFLLYFTLLLSFGIFFHKKQTSSTDFIMGNRSLNFWLVGLSAHASDMSAWLFMGLPMSVFLFGLSQAWIAVGLVIGMYLNWHFVAPKLRVQTEKYDCYTLSSFFEKRFNDKSGWIRLISAIMFILFLTHYLSAGMIGIGLLLESLFNLNYHVGLLIAMVTVVVYTFIGGFNTVAWTDLLQGMFLLCMIILVPILAFFKLSAEGLDLPLFLHMQHLNVSKSVEPSSSSFFALFSLALSWGIGYFGMPHVITKFMGIRTATELKKSKWLGISWQILVLSASIMIGFIALAYFPMGLEKPELVFVEMVKDLFPSFIAGFILCAVLAAGMSTMDSQILVCASVLSEDLYPRVFKISSIKQQLNVSRFGVVIIAGIALTLSLNKSTTIMESVGYSWAGLGSSFGPLVLTSLYSRSINRYGALTGILVGGATVMCWSFINPFVTSFKIEPMLPGFSLSLFSMYVVSYLVPDEVSLQELSSEPVIQESMA